MVGLFCSPAHAKRFFVEEPPIKSSSGLRMGGHYLASGEALYSAAIPVPNNVGFASLLIVEDFGDTAGDVDISVQYSIDGVNFYTAYTTDMAGTVTAEGNIVTGIGNESRWIVIPVRMAKFLRFLFDADSISQITAKLIYQQQR